MIFTFTNCSRNPFQKEAFRLSSPAGLLRATWTASQRMYPAPTYRRAWERVGRKWLSW